MKTTNLVRTTGWLAVAGLLGAALISPATTLATQPDPGHKVTICHRTASDTNPYVTESVDIASSGHLQGGHDTQHQGPIWDATLKAQHIEWGDIIPPYTYGDFSFDGYNWTEQGQAILAADCTIPTTTTTTSSETSSTSSETSSTTTSETTTTSSETSSTSSETSSTTTSDTSSQTTSETTSDTTSQTTSDTTSSTTSSDTTSSTTTSDTTSQTTSTTTDASPSGSVLGETGVPQLTPPPTDTIAAHSTPANGSWRMLLMLAAAMLAGLLIATPATARKRR